MEDKTLKALSWIVNIFNKHKIPYRIGGGFAAHIYGSGRPVNDIDITLSGKYFPIIISEIMEYITAEPKHYSDEKWDCDGFSLDYLGQEIDITDIDTLCMSNKEQTEWFQTKENYCKFPNIFKIVNGIEISLIDPRDLVSYKKELADKDHQYQLVDIKAVEKYIVEQGII